MHENTFFVFPFFEMQFLCFFVFLCNTHPFSFHYIFFGTFYNYISLQKQNKHNNKLNTNTTFKTTKQKPSETLFTSETTQEQWWRVVPRATATATGTTRHRERGKTTGSVDQPLPFLLSPVTAPVTCKHKPNAQSKHTKHQCFGFLLFLSRFQICSSLFQVTDRCRGAGWRWVAVGYHHGRWREEEEMRLWAAFHGRSEYWAAFGGWEADLSGGLLRWPREGRPSAQRSWPPTAGEER